MKILILGAGWYGCHLALSLLKDNHEVKICEIKDDIFKGASGANPARIHLGFHYPRSKITRAFCQEHYSDFMKEYGSFTSNVPINIYAIAKTDSLMDYGTYYQIIKNELPVIPIEYPEEYGLKNVEGAILTGERHIIISEVKYYFKSKLKDHIIYNTNQCPDNFKPDITIDCTFCANESSGVDRYEPCITVLLKGPINKSITIMDGPFPSLYVWNPNAYLSSLTSALYTPLDKCKTREEAENILSSYKSEDYEDRCYDMMNQMAHYYSNFDDEYKFVRYITGIRAQPKSGSDARFVDVIKLDNNVLRVRAGKIDAVVYAEKLIKDMIK